jgi:hypothetical protein
MSYNLSADDKVCQLKKKIEQSGDNIFPTDIVYSKYIRVQTFRVNQSHQIMLTYMNPENNGSFTIPIILTYADLDANHTGRYNTGRHIKHQNALMIGFSIGDLIRHFLHMKGHMLFTEQFPHLTDQNLCDRMKSCFKKVMRTESSDNNYDMLGTIHYTRSAFHIWNNLIEQKLIKRKNDVFDDYAKQVVYVSEDTIRRLVEIRNINGDRSVQINDDQVTKFLNMVPNSDLIINLMKYYVYNEMSPDEQVTIYTFEEPTSILNILEKMCCLEENDTSNKYRWYRDQLRRKLSPTHQEALDETYPETIFTEINDVPAFYPFDAYRKIYLLQWTFYDIYTIENKYKNTKYCKDDRLRHRIEKVGQYRIIPYGDEYYQWHDSWTKKIRDQDRLRMKRDLMADIRHGLHDD